MLHLTDFAHKDFSNNSIKLNVLYNVILIFEQSIILLDHDHQNKTGPMFWINDLIIQKPRILTVHWCKQNFSLDIAGKARKRRMGSPEYKFLSLHKPLLTYLMYTM